jgi:hypothetical protein
MRPCGADELDRTNQVGGDNATEPPVGKRLGSAEQSLARAADDDVAAPEPPPQIHRSGGEARI